MAETLWIATAVANPLHWGTRISLAKAAIASWLTEPNVNVVLTECLFGSDTDYLLSGLASDRVTHIGVRANTAAWAKENLLNLAIAKMPSTALKIATIDADVTWRQPGWALRTVQALNLYQVVQPWTQALDLGPQDQVMATHTSFASVWHAGKPIVPIGTKFWTDSNYTYPHPGYAWAWQRNILDDIGGLYEQAGMGAADHTMAVALTGKWQLGVNKGMGAGYRASVGAWSDRAYALVKGKLGFTGDTIEHPFHGKKVNRGYQNRWTMFVDAGFDPTADLKKNTYGVLEFSGNKPALELQWLNYLRSRDEDVNSLGG
jgi:hypothetical protein